jgi:hypothetical protein
MEHSEQRKRHGQTIQDRLLVLEREEYVFFFNPRHAASTCMEKNGDYQFLINLLPFLEDIAPSRKISAYN